MKGLQESLQRLATHNMVKKVLSTVAQWERHAVRFCSWRMVNVNAQKGEMDLGLGWWELLEHENYQVGVADATAAMIHAIQFGGAQEFGGSIRDLTIFVREYVQSCRLTCAIKRYTYEEKKEKIICHQLLRTAFVEAEESRANFEEQARVITSKLPKKFAETKTFDGLHILALQRSKTFDQHMDYSRDISDSWLALQNVHSFQALSRLYPRLVAIEKEMEDTMRSMTELTQPGGGQGDLETDVLEEEEPKKDEHPKKHAQRRRETMRKRRLAMERKLSVSGDSAVRPASRHQLSFEDKAAHEKQLADLNRLFKKISDDVELNLDKADRGRIQHLFALLNQGQQKMTQIVASLASVEMDANKYEVTLSEKLRSKYEKWAMESLKRGRVPTEMDASSLRRGSGPTAYDRDELRRKSANFRMDIEARLMVGEEERELKDALEDVTEKLEELIGAARASADGGSAGEHSSNVMGDEDLGLPTLEPVRKALDLSICYGREAQELAFTEFVQLTTSCAKIERKAQSLGQTMSNLIDGQIIGKPQVQEAEWQGACQDLILDMEQVLDHIKVEGLPSSILDKFWQEKQIEIRAAQQNVEDLNDKKAKKAQRENKKLEMKLEAAIQEQDTKKKQLLLGMEVLMTRVQQAQTGDDKTPAQGTPRAAAPRGTIAPPSAPEKGPRATVVGGARASQLGGPAGAVMERILQSHRADIASGHQRRKALIEDIRKLQEKVTELEPPKATLTSAEDPETPETGGGIGVTDAAVVDEGELHETGQEEVETVDWLGLNQRLGNKDADNKPQEASGPAGDAAEGQEGETKEESSSSSSSSSSTQEDRPVLAMDPWIVAFPFDPPDLAKRKFDFCQQHRIKTHRLHEMTRQKKYQFLLRRLIKQEKRNLTLKQKLLLKFLTGDELQKAKDEMKKGPADLKAEAEVERGKLRDRQAMISKLLGFWQRRMKSLEDDQDAEREAFRMKVRALLEDIHSLAVVLESAALTKKRRRRIEAEDLLRLRQQKAEEAARQQVEEERESLNTNKALMAARETEDQGSMTALQKMAAFARRNSRTSDKLQDDDAIERKRLANMLRSFLDQRKGGEPNDENAAAFTPLPGRTARRPSVGRRISQRHSSEAQDPELRISASAFHQQTTSAPEVPTQTLNAETGEDGEGKTNVKSSSFRTGLVLSSKQSRRNTRGTAKRKPSVAQRDSIFANPAAMSRRITGDVSSSAARTATVEVTLAGGVGNPDTEVPGKKAPTSLATLPTRPKAEEDTGDSGTDSVTLNVVAAETWSLGDRPAGPTAPLFGGLKGSQGVKGKLRSEGRLQGSSSTPEGSRRPSTVRKPTSQRPSLSRDHTPIARDNSSAQVLLSIGAEHRNSFIQGHTKSPESRQSITPSRPASAEESPSPSRRGSEREIDHEEVRAEMFLKATYMHLGGARQRTTHPALKSQKAAMSDALFCVNGERLFRGLVAQVIDLPPDTAMKVVKNILNTERGRCLFIIKNSLIHQARLELEASQRVIHILEQDLDEVQRQLNEGGPLFPLSGKPASDASGTSSSASEGAEDVGEVSPKNTRASPEEAEATSPRVRNRRAGMHSFMAFASSMARSHTRRPTAVTGESEVEAPLLQIRSAEASLVPPVQDDARAHTPSSPIRKRGSKSVAKPFVAPTNLAERLREAQLAADAQGSRGSQIASEKGPTVGSVFTSSLASSMLKTMLKKNAPAPEIKTQKSSMSLIGDYAWDKVVKKLESNMQRRNFYPDLAAGQWKSHFSWDLLNEDPLSSRLPQDRPRSAPPLGTKHNSRKRGGTIYSRPTAAATTEQEGNQEQPEGEAESKPTSAPMIFALAKFMSRMRNKKPSNVDEFFYVNGLKEKWQQRTSRLKLLTEEMEEEWQELRDKVIKEKGQWLQKSRLKVEQMELHLEEELNPGGFDRQQRTLRERGAVPKEQKGFDAISFVRWKVNKQLQQAMQEAERGGRVGPVTRERTAGPPPHEPVWIVGDQRYNNSLEASRQRIATIRAKKSKDRRHMKNGRGRGWRLALNVFEHLDEKLANPDDFLEDSESETDSSGRPFSRSHSITREPGHFRRSRRRRTSQKIKGRELSVLSPWMRSEFMSDEEYDMRPESWDLRCWLQPVRHRARTATDRVFTPEHRGQALSRKGSRSDPGGPRSVQDPVLMVQQACRQLVEDFENVPEEEKVTIPSVRVIDAAATEAEVMDDFDSKHSKVMEILERDSLLNQEPLDSVAEEEDDAGSASEHAGSSSNENLERQKEVSESKESRRVLVNHSLPMLSTQTLMFESNQPAQRSPIGTRPGPSLSTSVPSLHSDNSQGSLHASPRRGPALAPHAVRVAAARHRGAVVPPKGHRGRRRSGQQSRYEMFHVLARPMQDRRKLESLERSRRSLVRDRDFPTADSKESTVSSRRSLEFPMDVDEVRDAPKMTVNLKRLTRVLAKQWTEVSSEEVEQRRVEMERMKVGQKDSQVHLDTFFEYNLRTATTESEDLLQVSEDGRMLSQRGTSGVNVKAQIPPKLPDATRRTSASQKVQKLQKHLEQLKNWRKEGKAPSSPVPTLPLVVKRDDASRVKTSKATPSKEMSSRGLPEEPISATKSADQYLAGGFQDSDLNSLLKEISQTDIFPEGGEDEFVWAPRKVELSRLPSRGEAWIKAIVRGDSPSIPIQPTQDNPFKGTTRLNQRKGSPAEAA